MTYNEDLQNLFIKHQILVQRLSKHTAVEVAKAIAKGDKPLEDYLLLNIKKMQGGTKKEELAFIAGLLKRRTPIFEGMSASLYATLKDFAEYEALFTAEAFTASLPVELSLTVPVNQTLAEALADLPVTGIPATNLSTSSVTSKASNVFDALEKEVNVAYGKSLKALMKRLQDDEVERILSQVRIGIAQGEDVQTIAKRVAGNVRLKRTNGIIQQTKNSATTIARTAISDIQNKAREAMYDLNADIVEKVQFLATLDSRTSDVCRARDGKVYPRNKAPRPPLHPNCRSLLIPVIVDEILAERPFKANTEKQLRREWKEKTGANLTGTLPYGTRTAYRDFARARVRELTGRVGEGTTYQKFLEKQSAQFQDDVLGKTKGALFRRGGLKLERFVDETGKSYNLKQLAQREAQSFKDAGLNLERYR
jgi:SPP1 gp7 family putative phage head morphogenesis protein